jgi:hypothetical protein
MNSSQAPRFEAMTTGMLLDHAFRLYAQNFSLMLGITAAAYVPLYAIMLLVESSITSYVDPSQRRLIGLLSQLLFIVLWTTVAFPIATGAGTYAVSERYLGNAVTIGQALARALKRFWTLSVAQLSVATRVVFGVILLVIPGILWSLSYALVVPIVLVEGHKALPSLKRSWDLVKGYRKKVFAILVVVYVLQWLLGFGMGSLANTLFALESTTANVMESALSNLLSIFMTPFGIIADILLYYDLRIRKEGFDLEMLSRAFSVSPNNTGATPIRVPDL